MSQFETKTDNSISVNNKKKKLVSTNSNLCFRLEQAFGDSLHRSFPTVNTRLKITQAACDAAKYFLNETQMNEPTFAEMLREAEAKENQLSDDTEKIYKDFMDELIDIATSPNM